MTNYPVDLESLKRNFPSGFEPPPTLLAFGGWIREKPWGSVGCFRVESERFDDFWIENGADLHPNFAFFMRDPTGGKVGYWLIEGPRTEWPPVVLVGSEGETRILASSLVEFLRRLAAGDTGAPDLDSRGVDETEAAELTEWLAFRTDDAMSQQRRAPPDLLTWMDEWGRRQREWIDNDVHHLEIANRLRRYLKPNPEPWDTACFDVLLVGAQFRMWHRSYGLKPIPDAEAAALEVHFRAVREQRARRFPDRGLWFSAWVKVGATGGAVLCCNYMDQPEFLDQKPIIPGAEYQRDLRAFPRSEHWMPDWLK